MNIEEKTKLAHEYLLRFSGTTVADAWQYADAMEAEAEKRMVKLPEVLKDDPFEGLYPLIDWHKYGKGLYFWAMDENGRAFWHNRKPEINGGKWGSRNKYRAPSFNYRGDWKDSLRKRPK